MDPRDNQEDAPEVSLDLDAAKGGSRGGREAGEGMGPRNNQGDAPGGSLDLDADQSDDLEAAMRDAVAAVEEVERGEGAGGGNGAGAAPGPGLAGARCPPPAR